MKFITYEDADGTIQHFDASRVMFTMSHPIEFDESAKPTAFLTKVALDANMGFILTREPADSIIERIKAANGIE
jgi:hypothetical protein